MKQKSMILVILGLVTSIFLVACNQGNEFEDLLAYRPSVRINGEKVFDLHDGYSREYDISGKELLSWLATGIVYFKYEEGDSCFAYWRAHTQGQGEGLTYVPCEKIPKGRINTIGSYY